MAVVEVKARADKYRQEISAGTHTLAADVSKEIGGEDSAPNPHELLLASLGACTAITVQMYAKRKGWDLQAVNVNVKEEQVENPDAPGGKITKFTRTIEFTGDLNQEQVDGLRTIADKCPIHKLLSGPTKIETSVSQA